MLFFIYKLGILLISLFLILKLDKGKSKNHMGLILFMVYLFLILEVTSPGVIYDINRYGISKNNINIKPFSEEISKIGYILNIFMFMPLGFLLPILWKEYSIKRISITGLIFSFIIEFFQLFNPRASDIDDLIMNTLGTIIGYMVFKVSYYILGNKERIRYWINNIKININPIIVFLIYILVRFFLYDEFYLAKLIYKF